MKVLIIGGSGHVGSRLAIGLAERGFKVGITSRNYIHENTWAQGLYIQKISDILTADWRTLLQDYEQVIHLVSPQENECLLEPERAKEVVVDGTRRVVTAAAEIGTQVIYFSTSQVYGPVLTGVIDEHIECHPTTPYAAVHYEAEQVTLDLLDSQATVVRLSNSVGLPANPGANAWHLLVPSLVREAVSYGSITLKSSGVQHRSFVPLSEVVRAVEHLLKQEQQPRIVNICNPRSLSVRAMAERVRELVLAHTGTSSKIILGSDHGLERENPFAFDMRELGKTGFSLNCDDALDFEIEGIIERCLKG